MSMSDISFDHVLSSQYTVFDGLAGMHVEDIYQDRQGFLWIATADGGVSRFDSARFDTFGLKDGLPNLTVMAIAEDADGRLLFGAYGGGVAAYDGRDFQVYTTDHGLPSNEIVGLQDQPDGSILVLTSKGVAWFAEGRCIKCTTDVDGQSLGQVRDTTKSAWDWCGRRCSGGIRSCLTGKSTPARWRLPHCTRMSKRLLL